MYYLVLIITWLKYNFFGLFIYVLYMLIIVLSVQVCLHGYIMWNKILFSLYLLFKIIEYVKVFLFERFHSYSKLTITILILNLNTLIHVMPKYCLNIYFYIRSKHLLFFIIKLLLLILQIYKSSKNLNWN